MSTFLCKKPFSLLGHFVLTLRLYRNVRLGSHGHAVVKYLLLCYRQPAIYILYVKSMYLKIFSVHILFGQILLELAGSRDTFPSNSSKIEGSVYISVRQIRYSFCNFVQFICIYLI